MESSGSIGTAPAIWSGEGANAQAVRHEILAAKRGTLDAVFEAQGDVLRRVLRSYLVQLGAARGTEANELALDLYSELYLEAMKTAEKFDLTRAGVPWLLGIGYRLALRKRDDGVSLRLHEARLSDFGEGEGSAESDAEVFDRVAGWHLLPGASTPLETQHGAREMLALVEADDRALLQLAVVEGVNGDALATHLGIAPPAARQRLHRALHRLRVAYARHLNPPVKPPEVRHG